MFAHFSLSLLRAQRTQWLLLSSSSFSSNAHKQTHTQTHPHRQINTEIHKHTYTQTNPHRQTNREIVWCLTRIIGACGSCLIGACESCLIDAWLRGSGDWVLFEEWVWVLLVLQWRCLIFILNDRGREGARESEGFEMVVKLSMKIWPRGRGDLCSKMGIEMGREMGIESNK